MFRKYVSLPSEVMDRDPAHLRAAVTLEDVTTGYNGQVVVEGVTARIQAGERVAVVGPNGAGKSTLFKAIVGLLPLHRGHVCFQGQCPDPGGRLAYVPQRESIDWSFPVTVADVVMMGRFGRLGWFRNPGPKDRAVVMGSLERVGMAEYAGVQIGELSGGQQQRAFLARALAQEADIFLLDEPFTGVDTTTQAATFAVLDELQREGKTVIVATHDLNSVFRHFDRVLALNRRLIAYGTPEEVFTPEVLAATYGDQVAMLPTDGGLLAAINEAHFE